MSVSELLADIARNEEALPADLADMRAEGWGLGRPRPLQKMHAGSPSLSARAWAFPSRRSKPGRRAGARRTSCRRQSRENCEADSLGDGGTRS